MTGPQDLQAAPGEERTFRLPSSATTSVTLWMIGGLVACVAAAVGFLAVLFTGSGQLTVQLAVTVPILLAIGAFLGAWSVARTPSRVTVGPSGLYIERRRSVESYGWSQVGWSSIRMGGMNRRRHLAIYDANGGLLAKLSESIDGFDELADLVAGYLAAKADDTAERIQRSKARRSAVFVAIAAIVFLAVAGSLVTMTRDDERRAALLAEEAVDGEAEVVDRFLAPNGVTPRLVYRVITPDGASDPRNAEVDRATWDRLEGEKTVPVLYVPSDPSISRLADGEVVSSDLLEEPTSIYVLSALVAVMSLFFLGSAVLMWRGYDVDIDSKTRRISIKRFGTGR